jgi:hypothetical protein
MACILDIYGGKGENAAGISVPAAQFSETK